RQDDGLDGVVLGGGERGGGERCRGCRGREVARRLDGGERGAAAELHRCVAGRLAECERVLPDRDGLGAQGDAVQGCRVAVLARDRDLQADGGERLDDAGRHAVVLGQDRVDLVAGGVQRGFHVVLRV